MDIEIAKVISKKLITTKFNLDYSIDNVDKEAIDTVLSELEKKDKIIDLMSEQLAGLAIFDIDKDESLILRDKEEVKQYFKEQKNE